MSVDRCVSCDDVLDDEEVVTLLETAELLCGACVEALGDHLDTEMVAYTRPLKDVHPDWRAK